MSGPTPTLGIEEVPPLTPADPRFVAWWLARTAEQAQHAGVTQIARCRDGVFTPQTLEPY